MGDWKRQSPVRLASRPIRTEVRDHWEVVLAYGDEGPGPWLVDLSHKTRWDLQDGALDGRTPGGLAVPANPGGCRLENRVLVNRMNRTQAAVWHLGHGDAPPLPAEPGYTDVSEATVFLGLLGPRVFAIAEKLSALDFVDPKRTTPFLLQGPFSHVPCQVVTVTREAHGTGALLVACSRGYARDMVAAVSAAGEEFGLRPAGETTFQRCLDALEGASPSP